MKSLVVILVLLLLAAGGQGSDAGSDVVRDGISDRDRLRDGTGDGVPDRTQDRQVDAIQDRLRDGTGDGTPDRLRIHAVDVEQGRQVMRDNSPYNAARAMYVAAEAAGCEDGLCATSRQIRNSYSVQNAAEQEIRERNGFVRLLAGSDRSALQTLEQERNQNELRLRLMQERIENCDCDEQTKEQLRTWYRSMEQEQQRVQSLVEQERGVTGLFGWMWR